MGWDVGGGVDVAEMNKTLYFFAPLFFPSFFCSSFNFRQSFWVLVLLGRGKKACEPLLRNLLVGVVFVILLVAAFFILIIFRWEGGGGRTSGRLGRF